MSIRIESQHLRAMMLDARGVVLLRMFCSRYHEISNPLPTFLRSRRFERVRDWKATCTPPLPVAVQPGHKSFSHSSGTCLVACQVSYRASDARSCHSDILSTLTPKLEFSETIRNSAGPLRLISPQPPKGKTSGMQDATLLRKAR